MLDYERLNRVLLALSGRGQRDLARAAGVSPSMISRVYSGASARLVARPTSKAIVEHLVRGMSTGEPRAHLATQRRSTSSWTAHDQGQRVCRCVSRTPSTIARLAMMFRPPITPRSVAAGRVHSNPTTEAG